MTVNSTGSSLSDETTDGGGGGGSGSGRMVDLWRTQCLGKSMGVNAATLEQVLSTLVVLMKWSECISLLALYRLLPVSGKYAAEGSHLFPANFKKKT